MVDRLHVNKIISLDVQKKDAFIHILAISTCNHFFWDKPYSALSLVQSRFRSSSKAKLSLMNDQKVAITTSEYEVERSNSSVLSYLLEYNFSCMSLIGIRVCPRSRVESRRAFIPFWSILSPGSSVRIPGVLSFLVGLYFLCIFFIGLMLVCIFATEYRLFRGKRR